MHVYVPLSTNELHSQNSNYLKHREQNIWSCLKRCEILWNAPNIITSRVVFSRKMISAPWDFRDSGVSFFNAGGSESPCGSSQFSKWRHAAPIQPGTVWEDVGGYFDQKRGEKILGEISPVMWEFHQKCGKKTHWYGHMSKVSKGNFPVVIWHGNMAMEFHHWYFEEIHLWIGFFISIALEVRSPEASAEIPQSGLTSKWASPDKSPKSGQTSG